MWYFQGGYDSTYPLFPSALRKVSQMARVDSFRLGDPFTDFSTAAAVSQASVSAEADSKKYVVEIRRRESNQ